MVAPVVANIAGGGDRSTYASATATSSGRCRQPGREKPLNKKREHYRSECQRTLPGNKAYDQQKPSYRRIAALDHNADIMCCVEERLRQPPVTEPAASGPESAA